MSIEQAQLATNEQEPGGNFSFEQAMFMFSDDEREGAQNFLEIQQDYEKAFLADPSLYDTLVNGIKRLEDELGFEEVGHYKLYHLLTGSTLSEGGWKKYPMDTPGGHFQKLIEGEIVPILNKAA